MNKSVYTSKLSNDIHIISGSFTNIVITDINVHHHSNKKCKQTDILSRLVKSARCCFSEDAIYLL